MYKGVSEFTPAEAEHMRNFMHEKLGIDPNTDLNPIDIQDLEHVGQFLLM